MKHVPALLLIFRPKETRNPWFKCLRCHALYLAQAPTECTAVDRRQPKPRPLREVQRTSDALTEAFAHDFNNAPGGLLYWGEAPMPTREEIER